MLNRFTSPFWPDDIALCNKIDTERKKQMIQMERGTRGGLDCLIAGVIVSVHLCSSSLLKKCQHVFWHLPVTSAHPVASCAKHQSSCWLLAHSADLKSLHATGSSRVTFPWLTHWLRGTLSFPWRRRSTMSCFAFAARAAFRIGAVLASCKRRSLCIVWHMFTPQHQILCRLFGSIVPSSSERCGKKCHAPKQNLGFLLGLSIYSCA
jgi:hypothetical protein